MALWGNKDYITGNNKPLYANTTNVFSTSTIHGNGATANTDKYYGSVMGISVTEQDTTVAPQKPTHAGWISLKLGTGPVKSVTVSGGSGINSAGFLVATDAAWNDGTGLGSGVNLSFTIANSQNSLQSYSTNSALNTISTITVVNGGSGYSNSSAITLLPYGASGALTYTTLPTFTIELGGRGNRIQTETLVAMGSITLDNPRDNVFFSGI